MHSLRSWFAESDPWYSGSSWLLLLRILFFDRGVFLLESKLDPTIINGGVINSINNNAKLGKGDWAILEADESDGSFLKLPINYSIVTNIDYEHLDFYKNYENFED